MAAEAIYSVIKSANEIGKIAKALGAVGNGLNVALQVTVGGKTIKVVGAASQKVFVAEDAGVALSGLSARDAQALNNIIKDSETSVKDVENFLAKNDIQGLIVTRDAEGRIIVAQSAENIQAQGTTKAAATDGGKQISNEELDKYMAKGGDVEAAIKRDGYTLTDAQRQ